MSIMGFKWIKLTEVNNSVPASLSTPPCGTSVHERQYDGSQYIFPRW